MAKAHYKQHMFIIKGKRLIKKNKKWKATIAFHIYARMPSFKERGIIRLFAAECAARQSPTVPVRTP